MNNINDSISRQAAIDVIRQWSIPIYLNNEGDYVYSNEVTAIRKILEALPPAQPEIIYCRECKYGEQDDNGNWYCHGLGCTIGSEDGSGFCADAERKGEKNE